MGDVSGSVEVAAISERLVAVSDLSGSFVVRESVSTAFITAVNVRAGSVLDVSGLSRSRLEIGTVSGPDFEGYVAIRGGIPAESFVFVRCHNEGVIDLAGGDVDDFLETSGGGGHHQRRYGEVKRACLGIATRGEHVLRHGGVQTGRRRGVIEAEVSNIDGVIHVTGDMNGQLYARVGPFSPARSGLTVTSAVPAECWCGRGPNQLRRRDLQPDLGRRHGLRTCRGRA